ncbi:hypothetical protein M9458_016974, partial [Cirrhinus mrigala]
TYCRQHHIDLATVYDHTDLDEMMRVVRQFHIGDVCDRFLDLVRSEPDHVYSVGSRSAQQLEQ